MSGVEYQILDNANPNGGSQKAGWAYGLYAPPIDPKTGQPLDATKPIGRWNHVKLVCSGDLRGAPGLNGGQVPGIRGRQRGLQASCRPATEPFNKYPKFGTYPSGRIGLQGDHGNVAFANIKLHRCR